MFFTSSRASTSTDALPQQVSHHEARQHTLLIATTDQAQRAFLAAQLDADGHTVYEADSTTAAIARLSAEASTSWSSGAYSDRQTVPRRCARCVPASTRGSIPVSR
jgi:hypothetical protein